MNTPIGRILLTLAALSVAAFAQTHPQAVAKRFERGIANDSANQSFVIPADQQRGIELSHEGDNAALFANAQEANLPWFCRIQRAERFHIVSGDPTYQRIENPLVAFGEAGGATPLYLNRKYRFGIYGGARKNDGTQPTLPGTLRIRAYRVANLSAGQIGVAPAPSIEGSAQVELPWPGTTAWDAFVAAGGRATITLNGLTTTVEIVGAHMPEGSPEQWRVPNDPLIITHHCSSTTHYFLIEYQGWTTIADGSGSSLPIVSSTDAEPFTAEFSPLYTLDFTASPPWRSTLIQTPHFTGNPVPSWYYGKSLKELREAWGFAAPTIANSYTTATTVDNSPELRTHPQLTELVQSYNGDPMALANYVFNEVALADPVSYNEDGTLSDDKSINCGGVNRGALATFLEGQGNPWEQCALLIYLLRSAGVPAIYCEPAQGTLRMLDTQLSSLLRMQIRGAQNPDGDALMPELVPVNYPWVAAYVDDPATPGSKKWVHLFPWLKDTEVVEGRNVRDYLSSGTIRTGHEWVRRYLTGDFTPEQSAIYVEEGGNLVVEGEGFHLNNPSATGIQRWKFTSTAGTPDYSGAGYVQALPDSGTHHSDPNNLSASARLDFKVRISPGQYYVWVRGSAPGSGDSTVHVGIDSAGVAAAGNIGPFYNTVGWRNADINGSTAILNVTANATNLHTLRVWMAQDGFRLDKIILSRTSSPVHSGPYFRPDANGFLLIEAENYHGASSGLGHTWTVQNTSPPTGFNGQYVVPSPNASPGDAPLPIETSGSPRLDYVVNFPSAGTYYLWVRGQANASAESTIHFGIDGNPISRPLAQCVGSQFEWANVTGRQILKMNVTQGTHTINVWMGSNTFRFDRFALTNNLDLNNLPKETVVPPNTSPEAFSFSSSGSSLPAGYPGGGWTPIAQGPYYVTGPLGPCESGTYYIFQTLRVSASSNTSFDITTGPRTDFNVYIPTPGTYRLLFKGRKVANVATFPGKVAIGVDYQTASFIVPNRATSAWSQGRPSASSSYYQVTIPEAGLHVISLLALEVPAGGLECDMLAFANAPTDIFSPAPVPGASASRAQGPCPLFYNRQATPMVPATPLPSLVNSNASKQELVESDLPSHLFPKYVKQYLPGGGTGYDELGVRLKDRPHLREEWDEFPRPFQLVESTAHQFYTKLVNRPETFDTVRVQMWSDRNGDGVRDAADGVYFDTGEWHSVDFHNRRFYATTRTEDSTHHLRLYLSQFLPDLSTSSPGGSTPGGNFQGADRLAAQLFTSPLVSQDDRIQFEITHRRQRRSWRRGVAEIEVVNRGAGYASPVTVIVADPPPGNGSRRAQASVIFLLGGGIGAIHVTDLGSGYMEPPLVTVNGAGGSGGGAVLKAKLTSLTDRWQHPLGIELGQETVQKPAIRKGDMAAICLDYGRVTPRMLRMHAEDFWWLERGLDNNSSLKDDADFRERLQSTSAYLTGMEYFQKIGTFRAEAERLFKTRILTNYAAGLSKLMPLRNPNGTLALPYNVPKYAEIDMFFYALAYASNGSLHPDSGILYAESSKDFFALTTAEASAQEHAVIDEYYRDFGAISTVRLLHRARGGPNPVVNVTKANSNSVGNVPYALGSVSKPLKDWDPKLWSRVEAAFGGEGGDFAEAYITPGPIANAGGSYAGIGAMIYASNYTAALISSDLDPNNGGVGSDFKLEIYNNFSPLLNLTGSSTGNYSLDYDLPSSISNTVVASSTVNFLTLNDISVRLDNFTVAAPRTLQLSIVGNDSTWLAGGGTPWIPGNDDLLNFTGTTGQKLTQSYSTGTAGKPSFFSTVFSPLRAVAGIVGDPVDVVTGEFYIDSVDLVLPGPFPLEVRRNYGSQSLSNNEFGHGWKLAYFPYLVVANSDSNGTQLIYAAEMDGSVIAYRNSTTAPETYQPFPNDNPSAKNMHSGGVGSTKNIFNNRLVESTEDIDPVQPGNETVFRLSGPHGHLRTFIERIFPVAGLAIDRRRPYLNTWRDAQGNLMTFRFEETITDSDYGLLKRIEASNGNFVMFEYNVDGHIVEARTGDGRRISYTYDQFGDLRSVKLPDNAVHSYEYEMETTTARAESVQSSTHLLIKETKPGGRILENTYDSHRRVQFQRAVVDDTTAQPMTNAEFRYLSTQNADKTWDGYTEVRDALHTTATPRITTFRYQNSLIWSEEDPVRPPEVREWYPATTTVPNGNGAYPRSLKKITDRRGVVTFFKYDSRGNLVYKTVGTDATDEPTPQLADLDGDEVTPGQKAVTTWSYTQSAPLDRVETETMPSGVQIKWLYGNGLYPYLPTEIRKLVSGLNVSGVVRLYTAVTVGTLSAKGLLSSETTGTRFNSGADTALTTFEYTGKQGARGFPTRVVRPTGTSDPSVDVDLKYNLRGELIDERDTLQRTWKHSYDAMGRRIWSERRLANDTLVAWNYTYYNQNGEVEWTDGPRYDPEDYTWQRYDGHGRRVEEVRWRAQAKADGSGVEAPAGDLLTSTTFFKYDKFGSLREIRTPRRHSVWMDYDSIGRMTTRDFYSGYKGTTGAVKEATESFQYEPGGEISQRTDVLAGITRMYYNARGQIRKRENADASVEKWHYYLDGRLRKEFLRNGSYWETTYNDFSRRVERVLKQSDGSPIKSETKFYDSRGNCFHENIGGRSASTTYDDLDRVKAITGSAATVTSAQRVETRAYPDGAGRREEVNVVINSGANQNEQTVTLRDALGRVESAEVFGTDGARVRVSGYAYSADHHQATVTDGSNAGAIVTRRWTDTFGNPVLTKLADDSYSRSIYDSGGLLASHLDRAQRTTSYVRNWRGDAIQETRPGGVSLTMSYDDAGNLLSRAMPGGLNESAQYDSAGRIEWGKLTQGANPTPTRQIDYAYYLPTDLAHPEWAGLLRTVTDARNIVTTYSYDAALRTLQTTSDGPDPEDDLTRTFAYNTRDIVTSIVEAGPNATTAVSRTIGNYDEISTEALAIDGIARPAITQYFNAAAWRSSLTGAGSSRSFLYRADGLMTQASLQGTDVAASYGDNGLLTGRSNGYRTITVQPRDAIGRITDLRTSVAGVEILREDNPGWSDLDKISGLRSTRAGNGAWNETRGYLYDASGRLVSENSSPRPGAVETSRFHYDNSDNWNETGGLGIRSRQRWVGSSDLLHQTGAFAAYSRAESETIGGQARAVPLQGQALGADRVELTLDGRSFGPVSFAGWRDSQGLWSAMARLSVGSHSLQAVAVHPSGWRSSPATRSFSLGASLQSVSSTHDEMGNVAARSWAGGRSQTFQWDARSRLVKVIETGSGNPFTWTALYDGFDRRVRTIFIPQTGAAVTTDITFDPEVEFLEIGMANATETAWKLYGPDLSGRYGGLQGLGGLEYVASTLGDHGIVNDWWGNVVGTVASPGNPIAWSPAQFLAWGPAPGWSTAPQDGTQPLHKLLGYRGLTVDPPGFVQHGLRAYDPTLGRWLSPDPLGHAGSLSLYDYCDNDPVNGFDVDGRLTAGFTSGFSGTIAADASSSPAFGLAMMFGGTTRGGVEGLGIGVQNVSGYTNYQEHLTMFEGDKWAAGNAAWNPAYMAMRGFSEAGTGSGLQPSNLGQTLSMGQRAWSTVDGVLGTVGTVSVGVSGAAITRSVGLTGPAIQSALPPLRVAYETEVKGLADLGLSARAAGQDAQATARMLNAERDALKIKYREMSPPEKVAEWEARNMNRYQNPLGPTIEQLRAQGKTWEQIIESAARPGGSDLGF